MPNNLPDHCAKDVIALHYNCESQQALIGIYNQCNLACYHECWVDSWRQNYFRKKAEQVGWEASGGELCNTNLH
jgi:hypothetical protein